MACAARARGHLSDSGQSRGMQLAVGCAASLGGQHQAGASTLAARPTHPTRAGRGGAGRRGGAPPALAPPPAPLPAWSVPQGLAGRGSLCAVTGGGAASWRCSEPAAPARCHSCQLPAGHAIARLWHHLQLFASRTAFMPAAATAFTPQGLPCVSKLSARCSSHWPSGLALAVVRASRHDPSQHVAPEPLSPV